MMTTMWLSALGVYLPLWYLTRPLGNDGLWLAFSLFNLARGMTLGWIFLLYSRSERWLR
jgi:MATE family multidrug resistance protein